MRPDSAVGLKAVMVATAIVAFGFAIRFVLVPVPFRVDVPPTCTLTTDFWRGDEVLC